MSETTEDFTRVRTPEWWAAVRRDQARWENDPERCQDCRLVEACQCGGQWGWAS